MSTTDGLALLFVGAFGAVVGVLLGYVHGYRAGIRWAGARMEEEWKHRERS